MPTSLPSTDETMITIDGSAGEGGGQIVRSSLTLALITGKPFSIHHVRAGRKNPGLKRQHVTAVQAAARIGAATVEGDSLGSSKLVFQPQHLSGGDYRLDLQTAGSTMLVAQTLLPALLFAPEPSTIHLVGGTHNPMAPCFDFLQQTYLPLLQRMGGRITGALHRHGFYPAGGGSCEFHVTPSDLREIQLLAAGRLCSSRLSARVANLPLHIAERECDTFARKSKWRRSDCAAESVSAHGPGNVMVAQLEYEHVTETFTAIGRRGLSAEKVATGLWKEVQAYQKHGAPVGEHLADQLLLPLGLAAWKSQTKSAFRTTTLTQHSRTHIDILQRFLEIDVASEYDGAGTTVVTVSPRA